MIILGLDCATKTGWCIFDSETKTVMGSGMETFTKKRGESNGILFLRFRKWLIRRLGFLPVINLVMFEIPLSRFAYAAQITLGLIALVQEVCEDKQMAYASEGPTTFKKFATGKGNADKAAMISAAIPFLGRDPIDDNEADAVHIARYAAETYVSKEA